LLFRRTSNLRRFLCLGWALSLLSLWRALTLRGFLSLGRALSFRLLFILLFAAQNSIRDGVLILNHEEVIKLDAKLLKTLLLSTTSMSHSFVVSSVLIYARVFIDVSTIVGEASSVDILRVLLIKVTSLVKAMSLFSLLSNLGEIDSTSLLWFRLLGLLL